MAFPKYVSKKAKQPEPVVKEEGLGKKIWDWFSEPVIDNIPYFEGKKLREDLTTADLDEATDNDEYQWAPLGLPVGTAVGMILKPSVAKTKAFIGGGLEGVTPANIAEATTLRGTGGVLKQGVKTAGGLGKFLTNRTTTKKLIDTVPEYAKALENTSKLGSSNVGLTANAVLAAQGGYNALLNDENTTSDKVLGAVQAIGGAAGFGTGLYSRAARTMDKPAVRFAIDDKEIKVPVGTISKPRLAAPETKIITKPLDTDPPIVSEARTKIRATETKDKLSNVRVAEGDIRDVDTSIDNASNLAKATRTAHDKGDKAFLKRQQTQAKEVEKAGVQETRNENARRKFIKEQLTQDTRNENAVIKFTDKQVKEEKAGVKDLSKIITGWMDDLDQRAADAKAKQNVENALEGLEGKGKSVTIRSTDKSVPGETRSVSERFAPKEPEKPEGGGTIPYDPDLDGPDADVPVNKSILQVDPASTGPAKKLPKNVNKVHTDLRKATAIARNYGMGVRQNPDGLYEIIPKEQDSVAAVTGILTDDVFPTWADAKGAQGNVGGKIVGKPKTGFKVVDPSDPNPPYNPEDKATWVDVRGKEPTAEVPFDPDDPDGLPPAPAPVPAGPKPKGPKGGPVRGMAVAGPKSGKTPKNIFENYSPEELAELDQIIDEMDSMPHQPRTWNWNVGENEVGNAAGGKAIIQAGNAGAPVYHELLKFLSGLPETQGGPSRGQILAALKNFRKGNNNIWGRRAIEVAKRRLAKKSEPARLDEWVKAEGGEAAANVEGPKDPTVSSPSVTDEDTINSLLDIAVNAGYKGDLQTLKARLVAELMDSPSLVDVLKQSDVPWWEGVDEVAEAASPASTQADEVVDVLPTGEAQPRLPEEVGAVRDVENPNPEMEAPLGLTPPVDESPQGVTGTLFTPDELHQGPVNAPIKSNGGLLIEQMMAPQAPETPQGVIPVAAVKRPKIDVLRDHYKAVQAESKASGEQIPREFRDKPASGLGPAPITQGARLAGLGVSNLGKEAKVAAQAAQDVTDLASLPPELRKKAIAEMIKREREKGFAANELGIRSGLAIAGGLTGGAVAENNDIDPAIGMLAGGAAGFMSPSAAKALVEAANASGDIQAMKAATVKAKESFAQALQLVPDYVRASLLFNFPNLFINSWVGPYGSAVMGALEHLIANPKDPVPLNALKNLANPKKVIGAYGRNWKLAGDVIEQANNRGEISGALEKAPRLVRRALSIPGQFMTAGDLGMKDLLTDAGFSTLKARGMTLTDEPEMGAARAIREGMRAAQTEGGKKSILTRMVLPFHKTVINQAEASLERIPFIGIMANKAKDTADPANLQAAQQLLGFGVMSGMFLAGVNSPYMPTDPENLILMKVISNAGGQYGMLAVGAYAAGQAYANGADLREVIEKFGTSIVNNIPIPTMRPIKELGGLALDGAEVLTGQRALEDLAVPRSVWPQGLRPNVTEDIQNTGRLLKKGSDTLGLTEGTEQTPEPSIGIFGSRIR